MCLVRAGDPVGRDPPRASLHGWVVSRLSGATGEGDGMIYLLHIRYRTGREVTLEFPSPFDRALVAVAITRYVDLRCEDRP
jgi:hypothetical protein